MIKDKTYRREWAQRAALTKLRELRGKGWSDARIGRDLGGEEPISGTFIAAMLRDIDPKPMTGRSSVYCPQATNGFRHCCLP